MALRRLRASSLGTFTYDHVGALDLVDRTDRDSIDQPFDKGIDADELARFFKDSSRGCRDINKDHEH